MSCVVIIQCDNRMDSCLVFLAESASSPRHCMTFLEAVIMPNNAHQPVSNVRALESSSDEKMSKLAGVWYE